MRYWRYSTFLFKSLYKTFFTLSKIERLIFIGAVIIFLVSLAFWIGQLFYKSTSEKAIEGGNYAEGVIGQPIAVNPLIAANDTDRDLVELLYSDLLELVDNYESSKDQLVWTFNLKEKIQWSDGEPITSDDILFTLETIKDNDARSPLFPAWQGVVGERLSERQFRFILRTPYAFFLSNLKSLKIAPRHIFENIPTANLRLSNYNLEPLSSGPYKFVSYEKRDDGFITEFNLKINENYSGEAPFIKTFQLKFFSNKEDLVEAFNSREIDGVGGLASSDLENLKINKQVFKLNIPNYYAIFFNPSLSAPLKDPVVRQALALATDKNKIVSEVFQGNATIANGPIVPGIIGYNSTIYQNEEFSIEKANSLLDSKWVKDESGARTGTVEKKKATLEFDMIVPQVEFLMKTAELIKTDWEKIGVKINLVTMRPMDVNNEVIKTRNYQILLFGTILKTDPDLFSFWHSSERFYPGGNLAMFSNKSIDTALENIKINLDEKTQLENLSKIQSVILKERPAVFLFSPIYLYAANKNLKGFDAKFLPIRSNRFDNVNQWYLRTTRVFQ